MICLLQLRCKSTKIFHTFKYDMFQKEYSVENKNVPIDVLIEMHTYNLAILSILTGQETFCLSFDKSN